MHYAEIESVNNRFFEVNGCGAFQLSDYRPILHELLPIDPKLVSFNSIDEGIRKTIDYMKESSIRMVGKPYFPNRCYIAVMTDFYIACHVLKRNKSIVPPISRREIRYLMMHPATFCQVLSFRKCRFKNILMYVIGIFPPSLCVGTIFCLGKLRKLI